MSARHTSTTFKRGERIVIEYDDLSLPETDVLLRETPNFAQQRVGTVIDVVDDGIYVETRPLGHVVFVDYANYSRHGATWREWRQGDPWPTMAVKRHKDDGMRKRKK